MSPTTALNQRRVNPLVALLFLFASILAVVATPVDKAYAGDCGQLICVDPGGGGDDGGGDGGGTTTPQLPPGDDGGNGGGGGSGGVTPAHEWSQSGQGWFPRQPPGHIGGQFPDNPWSDTSSTFYYHGKCSGQFSWTAGGHTYSEPYAGWRWWLVGGYQDAYVTPGDPSSGVRTFLTATAGSYECIPPAKYIEYTLTCSTRASAYMIGPIFNSDESATQPRHNLRDKVSAFERSGRSNPDLCSQSYTYNFGRSPSRWGQYKLVGTARAVRCTYRSYYTVDPRTGHVPPTEKLGCSGQFVQGVDVAHAELFCNPPYVHKRWDNSHTFTSADCQGNNGTWTCGPQVHQQPTFAGQSGNPFAVLDDGKKRRAAWNTVKPHGDLRRITQKQAKLRFIGGSPYREGSSANASNQPFYVDPKVDQYKNGWRQAAPSSSSKTAWDMAFLAAGLDNHPWTAAPRWAFSAQFKSYVPDITWDLYTNTWTYTLHPVWIRADATCDGRPIMVDVNRARNSSH